MNRFTHSVLATLFACQMLSGTIDASPGEMIIIPGGHPPSTRIDPTLKAHGDEPYFHQSALQLIASIGMGAQEIVLRDGSRWSLPYMDSFTVAHWTEGSIVTILPNRSLFACTEFKLKNCEREEVVSVKMDQGPTYGGLYTRTIVELNDLTKQLLLNDGLRWQVSPLDAWKLDEWRPNDTIIVGKNSGDSSLHFPNLLINVNNEETLRVRAI
jgi:hypothetical protein